MAYPDLTYRSELPPVTRKELEQLCALIQAYLSREHNEAGGHTDITADSVAIGAGGAVTFAGDAANGSEDGMIENSEGAMAVRGPYVVLEATDEYVEVITPTSSALLGRVIDDAGTEHQFDDFLAALGALRLAGQGSYTPSANDTDAFAGDAFGPLYSFYRATPSADRTIDGISVNLTGHGRGHVLVIVNDSAFALTFNTVVVASAKKILGDPVTIGQDGAVIIVYDNTNQGWRIVASFAGAPIAFTPTWTGASGNPAIGDGTLAGVWQQNGRMVHFEILMLAGSTTTFGTGAWAFTTPTSINLTAVPVMSALALDAGAPLYRVGIARPADATKVNVFVDSEAGGVASAVPFAWANTDQLSISGTYLRG